MKPASGKKQNLDLDDIRLNWGRAKSQKTRARHVLPRNFDVNLFQRPKLVLSVWFTRGEIEGDDEIACVVCLGVGVAPLPTYKNMDGTTMEKHTYPWHAKKHGDVMVWNAHAWILWIWASIRPGDHASRYSRHSPIQPAA